ncbi:hypothetical protein C2W62_10285 [Candidatus Entotheonella serta]|nr:hypothetical protein C2W62_10285 [Candidatus Entotheonella serta]
MTSVWTDTPDAQDPSFVELHHFHNGPTVNVICTAFEPTDPDQVRLWAKTVTGWQFTTTEPKCLIGPVNLDQYIDTCVPFCEADAGSWVTDQIKNVGDSELLSLARHLWAATILLIKGWQVKGGDLIMDHLDPYIYTSPAPKVLQSQLDKILETYIVNTEIKFLDLLQKTLQQRRTEQRRNAFAAAVVFMQIIEKDTWRLMYWLHHRGEVIFSNQVCFSQLVNIHRRTNGGIRTAQRH